MTHTELCFLTGRRFHKDITLIDYQSWATSEFPDVLVFDSCQTYLYEIKIDYNDFKNDSKKECREEFKVKYFPSFNRFKREIKQIIWGKSYIQEFISEKPHLGIRRYYVCPKGLIQPEEVGKWGLYWIQGKRFYLKKESATFKRNMYSELSIITHALRKYASGESNNIIINPYWKR